jgi:pSer/pThr/pTyr-binding forkhead associated (FHA) protein
MKVSLVVASGAHQGKFIQIVGPQFLIGRDAGCNLRPASQAISKTHCGVLVRDGQVFVKDFGSTNGTLINDVLVRSAEVAVANGATLKLGPLDFIVRIEVAAPQPDGTPLPAATPEAVAALAAVKAATSAAAAKAPAPSRDATPNPAQAKRPAPAKPGSQETVKPGTKEAAALTGSKEAAALKGTPAKPSPSKDVSSPTPTPSFTSDAGEDDDKMAAMLLEMEEEGVPEGSTVVELPAVDAMGNPLPQKPKEEDKKKPAQAQTREEMTSAASDLLRKMMRRPK